MTQKKKGVTKKQVRRKSGTRVKAANELVSQPKVDSSDYDVCLTFATEDRAYVERVAQALQAEQLTVFYDDSEQASLWGKDLIVHLDEIYRLNSRFCVMFASKHYKKKLWTNHERRSAQARAFLEKREYILPVRLDETEIPGLLPTIGYMSAKDCSPKKIAQMVAKKIRDLKQGSEIFRKSTAKFKRIFFEGFNYQGMTAKNVARAIAGRWLLGNHARWEGRIVNGCYQLENRQALEGIINNRLIYSKDSGEHVDLSNGMASVKVKLGPPLSQHSGAGLLFRFDAQREFYFTFFRCPGQGLSFCRVQNGKLMRLWTGHFDAVNDDDFLRLTISGWGKRVELAAESVTVATLEVGNVAGYDAGVSAMGTGLFEFADFELHERVSS